jgi:hypothetical protein
MLFTGNSSSQQRAAGAGQDHGMERPELFFSLGNDVLAGPNPAAVFFFQFVFKRVL